MADRAIVRHEFVQVEDVDPDHVRCPRPECISEHLVLHGTSQMPRVEIHEKGACTQIVVDQSQHAFEMEIIECLDCKTRWIIKPAEVAELERRNEKLRQHIIKVTGEDPYMPRGRVH